MNNAESSTQSYRSERCIQSGNIKVRMSYAGECTLEEAVAHYLAARANASDAIRAAPIKAA